MKPSSQPPLSKTNNAITGTKHTKEDLITPLGKEGEEVNLICLGDFNIALSDLDIIAGEGHSKNSIVTFNNFIHTLGVIDSWRLMHPAEKTYTFRRMNPTVARRLDYIFTSELLASAISQSYIKDIGFSDHRLVVTRFEFSSFKFGKGSYLFSSDNKRYLDFVQGIAVNSLGHSHPKLIKTIKEQSKKLWHVSNAFQIPEGEKLAKKLCNKTFADYVMFQNSGTEATEAAVKVARRYFYSIGKPNKNRILCVKNSFHGRTLAAIFASGSKKMTEGFGPRIPGFDHFNFGNHSSLKK